MTTRWGRATSQLVCAKCKRIIEDGEGVLFRGIREGILCAGCGRKHEGAEKEAA
jgi:hypothetical protein